MFLQNEFDVDGLWNNEIGDDVIRAPLSDANEIIEWLKWNQPCSETEIDGLKRMIINFKMNDDVSIGDYGIREVYGQRMIFGPINTLYIQGDELIEYLLTLLDGLKEELCASNNMKLGLLHDEGNGTHSYSDQFFCRRNF